uniref:DUF4220 domain-containing protein n=1 Tax=Oryza glumipatula TaxID=40148 RepID=A0A0E0BTU9_9ORYZ
MYRLFRLTRRDLLGLGVSSGADGGDVASAGANQQKPALHVLYLLALVQGVLYFYRMTFISTGRRMEWKVTKRYRIDNHFWSWISPIFQYAEETRAGCRNDPSFAKGRNLVTYAVGLIESAPADTERLLGGLTIMEFLLYLQHSLTNNTRIENRTAFQLLGQRNLMRQLVISSTSSGHIQRKLLKIVCPSSTPTD